jgi:hypothetical protein
MQDDNYNAGIVPSLIDVTLEPIPVQIMAAGAPVDPEYRKRPPEESYHVAMSPAKKVKHDSRRLITHDDIPFKSSQRSSPLIVGPDSVQMKAIQRMIVYLEESEEPDTLLEHYCKVAQQCEIRHQRRENKYMHLPGAIFEKLVESIGGTTFGRIYENSKAFRHDRLYELNLVADDTTVARPRQVVVPDLLQLAVGYGLHLAGMLDSNPPPSPNGTKSIQDVVQDAAKLLVDMNEHERQVFWQYMLDSPRWKESEEEYHEI